MGEGSFYLTPLPPLQVWRGGAMTSEPQIHQINQITQNIRVILSGAMAAIMEMIRLPMNYLRA